MQRDHASRLTLSCTYFILGLVALLFAFVPAKWPSMPIFLALDCLALAIASLLSRSKLAVDLWSKAPSGAVAPLKGFFAFVAAVASVPGLFGFALFFLQQPIGHWPRSYPGSMLALFALYPLACAYLTLAASGRKGRRFVP